MYTAHLYDNGTELPQLKYALRYTDAASAEEVVGSFSLGQAAYSADLYTGNKVGVQGRPRDGGAGCREARGGHGAPKPRLAAVVWCGSGANGVVMSNMTPRCVSPAVTLQQRPYNVQWPWSPFWSPWLVYGSLHAGFWILPCI